MIIPDIEHLTKKNTNYRQVFHTGQHCQLVLMSLPVGTNIGMETHENADQLIFVVDGKGEAIIGGKVETFEEDDMIVIPSGMEHDIRNTDDEDLKLYVIYSPPMHAEGTVHKTRNDALEDMAFE